MKTPRIAIVVPLVALMFAAVAAFAHEEHKSSENAAANGQLVPAKEADAAWLEKARAEYPLTTCVVSGDEFDGGDMGQPKDFVYRVEGKPDRLVRFCCPDCVDDFNKDPAKYLGEIAAAKKSKQD